MSGVLLMPSFLDRIKEMYPLPIRDVFAVIIIHKLMNCQLYSNSDYENNTNFDRSQI